MNPVVSIMAQGGMGAATAARLVENGIEVRTVLAGRSAASAERARKAGMKPVTDEELVAADFILSIVPPAEAIPLAKRWLRSWPAPPKSRSMSISTRSIPTPR
jgi:putative dehydrogenase